MMILKFMRAALWPTMILTTALLTLWRIDKSKVKNKTLDTALVE